MGNSALTFARRIDIIETKWHAIGETGLNLGAKLERFGELEQKIRGFVEEYSVLKERNLELEKLLEGKSAELEEANNRTRVLNNEKDAVRTKVDMILDMLHDVEVP